MHETAKITRNEIQADLTALQKIFSSVYARLGQVECSNALIEVKRRWNDAVEKLSRDVGLGLRVEALIPLLIELFSLSRNLIVTTQEETSLDVDSERLAFDNLSRDREQALRAIPVEPAALTTSLASAISPMFSELNLIYEEIEKISLVSKQAITLAENLNNQFGVQIDSLHGQYKSAVDAYNRIEPELNQRANRLDELIRLQGNKVLAGRYEVDADNEEKAANRFRYATLGVMLTVIILIGLSYYEVSEFTLSPIQAGIRIMFSLILSVPAAYLARESAKHRQRQYVLRQTALEIGAIDSYIQTLPIDSQNKIKEEIAIKLFTPQKLDGFDKDSYPINTQEIFSKLIDSLAELKKEVKSKKDSKKDED